MLSHGPDWLQISPKVPTMSSRTHLDCQERIAKKKQCICLTGPEWHPFQAKPSFTVVVGKICYDFAMRKPAKSSRKPASACKRLLREQERPPITRFPKRRQYLGW